MKNISKTNKTQTGNGNHYIYILITFFLVTGLHAQYKSSGYKNSPLYKKKSTKVVYVFKMTTDGSKTEVNGTEFLNGENYLVGILKRDYYEKNKSRVKSKYSNCTFMPGTVTGSPKITQNIYVEPKVGDEMLIEAKYLSRRGTGNILFNCQKKRTSCSVRIDTNLIVYLYVTQDRLNNANGHSSQSQYLIKKIKSTAAVLIKTGKPSYYNVNSPNPKYIKFKQLLITSFTGNKYTTYKK